MVKKKELGPVEKEIERRKASIDRTEIYMAERKEHYGHDMAAYKVRIENHRAVLKVLENSLK